MIQLKTESEIEKMRQAGAKLARVLNQLKDFVKPGIRTKDLNQLAEKLIAAEGAKPNFKNFQGFPASLCTSVNEVTVHQIPSEYQLKEGDILSLDIGLEYQGFQADMALTRGVGKITPQAQKLIEVTQAALFQGIDQARVGNRLGDIGTAVQSYVESQGFGIVRELTGHGIGRKLHEDPDVFNFGEPGKGWLIKPGLVICIEPVVSAGSTKIILGSDKSGYQTADGSLSAHFEHMIAVTPEGPQILTELR